MSTRRSWLGAALAVAAMASVLIGALPSAAPVAAAPGATFDPIPSRSYGSWSVDSRVVAAGGGRYYAVARQDLLSGQRIVVSRSDDGGRTWTDIAGFSGEDGGAMSPELDAEGDHVAVTFIGQRCETPTFCPRTAYLAASDNGGVSWTGPTRLLTATYDAQDPVVAVEGDQTWVAFSSGGVHLMGTNDLGRTFFETRRFAANQTDVELAAANGTTVLAWNEWTPTATQNIRYVLARRNSIGAAISTPFTVTGAHLPYVPMTMAPKGVAAAGGRAHLLAVRDDHLLALTVRPGAAAPIASVDLGPAPITASIDARPGLIAVALDDTTTDELTATAAVAISTDDGATFSGPTVVGLHAPRSTRVFSAGSVTVALPDSDRPTARFSWSVPPSYVKGPNSVRVPANSTGVTSLDRAKITADEVLTTTVDGCSSTATPPHTIATMQWTVDGVVNDETGCRLTLDIQSGQQKKVRLQVTDERGVKSVFDDTVAPKDLLVVSIGDSVASGEGNPERAADTTASGGPKGPGWTDDTCHRSELAGPALAAAQLEDADPHSAVTFVHLACSGAAVMDVPPFATPATGTDATTGGLLDGYEGIQPTTGVVLPSQVDQLQTLAGGRQVDALLLSIGANDTKFSETLTECLRGTLSDLRSCDRSITASRFTSRLSNLPNRYALLAAALTGAGVAADRVYATEYFDPTTDDLGQTNLRCVLNAEAIAEVADDVSTAAGLVSDFSPNPLIAKVAEFVDYASSVVAAALDGGLITDDEAAWAQRTVVGGLNSAVANATQVHGWHLVSGIASQFARHGYCSDDPWVVRLQDSFTAQWGKDGAFHPNAAGHEVYGDALFAALRPLVTHGTTPVRRPATHPVGDIYVSLADGGESSVITLRATGGEPQIVAHEMIDRTVLGLGGPFPADLAASAGSAVATWLQYDATGLQAQPFSRIGQIASASNASVEAVRITQAPDDAALAVTGRPTLVHAIVEATMAGPETLDVTTEVKVTSAGGATRTVYGPTSSPMRLNPGKNDLLLPPDRTFTLDTGETLSATVTVSDPLLASPQDEVDNTASTEAAFEPTAKESRGLRWVFVPASIDGVVVPCDAVARVAQQAADYASTVLPVSTDGVQADVSCAPLPISNGTGYGIGYALVKLDERAQMTAVDAVIAVVPQGWLHDAQGGAVGIAGPNVRGIIMEAGTDPVVASHEFSHTLGIGHTDPPVPASGADVATRTAKSGVDWMNVSVARKLWTGGATWDALLPKIMSSVPKYLGDTPSRVVHGMVTVDLDGTIHTIATQFEASPPPCDWCDLLEVERMVAEQVDANGAVVATQDISLVPVSPMMAAGMPEPTTPLALSYKEAITLDPAAVSIRLVMRGNVIATYAVSAAPSVTVDSPDATTVAGRGDALSVAWTATDPEGDPLTAAVLVSDDGGTTWNAIQTDLTASPATVTVPADLANTTNAIVRVVVNDGMNTAFADSAPFTIGASATEVRERIAFVRTTTPNPAFPGNNQDVVYTMAPDGTDVTPVPAPLTFSTPINLANTQWGGCDRRLGCVTQAWDPTVAPDGTVFFASTLALDRAYLTPDEVTRGDTKYGFLFAVSPDGSNLRRIPVDAGADARAAWPLDATKCPEVNPQGTKLMVVTGQGIVVANLDGSSPQLVAANTTGTITATFPGNWPANRQFVLLENYNWSDKYCPHWSPDGTRIASNTTVSFVYDRPGVGLVLAGRSVGVVMNADGTDVRVLSDFVESPVAQLFRNPLSGRPSDVAGLVDSGTDQTNLETFGWLDDRHLVQLPRQWYMGDATPTYFRSVDIDTGAVAAINAPTPPVPDPAVYSNWPSIIGVQPDGSGVYGEMFVSVTARHLQTLEFVDNARPDINAVAGQADHDFHWTRYTVTPTGGGAPQVVVPPAVAPAAADAGGPYTGVVDTAIALDAGRSGALRDDPTAVVTWDLDGDGAFDDATGVSPLVSFPVAGTYPVRVRIEGAAKPGTSTSQPVNVVVAAAPTPTFLVSGLTASDTTDPSPDALAQTITIEAGSSADVVLQPLGQTFDVLTLPTNAGIVVTGLQPALDGAVGATDGTAGTTHGSLHITVGRNVRGTSSLTLRAHGTSTVVRLTIVVTANTAPTVRPDSVTMTPSSTLVLAPTALLRNDIDPDSATEVLRVVGVGGASTGEAWLGTDGRVHISSGAAGRGTFRYTVADSKGAISTGVVTLTVRTAPSPPTTTEPSAPPTTSPADHGGFGLPATGSNLLRALRWAFGTVALGGVLVGVRRRGTPRR